MNKDFCELTIIRLQTEMENAIGFREYYLKEAQRTGNNIMFEYWDTTLDQIINEIIKLGGDHQCST